MGQVTRTNFGLTKTRVLTNAEIINLPLTGIEIVPAIANSILVPVSVGCFLDWSVDYASIDANASIRIGDVLAFCQLVEDTFTSVSDLLAAGEDAFAIIPPTLNTGGAGGIATGVSLRSQFLVNHPLKIFADNGVTGIFTGGDAATSMTVTIYYNVFPVA